MQYVFYTSINVIVLNIPVANATVDQKARLLEQKVAENMATIEQLRQERSMLIADHKALQKRYTEASKVCASVIIRHEIMLMLVTCSMSTKSETSMLLDRRRMIIGVTNSIYRSWKLRICAGRYHRGTMNSSVSKRRSDAWLLKRTMLLAQWPPLRQICEE